MQPATAMAASQMTMADKVVVENATIGAGAILGEGQVFADKENNCDGVTSLQNAKGKVMTKSNGAIS